jgi:hypothetical protein
MDKLTTSASETEALTVRFRGNEYTSRDAGNLRVQQCVLSPVGKGLT